MTKTLLTSDAIIAAVIALLLATSCASLVRPSRAPVPTTAPAPGAPATFTWRAPVWHEDMVLSYEVETHLERSDGVADEGRTTYTFQVVQHTATGTMVRTSAGGVAYGDFWVDTTGIRVRMQRTSQRQDTAWFPWLIRRYDTRTPKPPHGLTWVPGQRRRVDTLVVPYPAWGLAVVIGEGDPRVESSESTVLAEYTFVGYRLLEGRRVAEIRIVTPNTIKTPFTLSGWSIVTVMTNDDVLYLDEATFQPIATHETRWVEGTSQYGGYPWSTRLVTATRLDLTKSRGI